MISLYIKIGGICKPISGNYDKSNYILPFFLRRDHWSLQAGICQKLYLKRTLFLHKVVVFTQAGLHNSSCCT